MQCSGFTSLCDWSKKKPRHPLNQSDVKSKPIATRSLTFSRFSHVFFLFFLFFFWVSSYLASCEELLLVPKNTKKLFQTITCALQTNSMHCQKSEIVSHQRALKSSRIILFPLVFFRKTLRIGADGTSERERTRGLRREKERRTARFVVTLSQTPPIFSHPSFARLY